MVADRSLKSGRARSSTSPCCSSSSLWTVPTAGLLVSSLRDKDQLVGLRLVDGADHAQSRPRSAALPAGKAGRSRRTAASSSRQSLRGCRRSGTVDRLRRHRITGIRASSRAGETADLATARRCTVNADGSFEIASDTQAFEDARGQRIFYVAALPPHFTARELSEVLISAGIGQSFVNSLTVTIPATIIPILIAAYAAYALAWMKFPGRALLLVAGRRPARRAAADVADPAAEALQRRRRFLRRAGEDLSRHLARPYRLRPAARDLSPAQLHRRPAARDDGIGARSTAPATSTSSCSIVLPLSLAGARLVRDLPVPLGVERPAGRHRLPRRAERPARAHRAAQPSRLARRQLGNPDRFGLRHHRRAARRVPLAAALPRPRPARRLGQG